MRIYLLRHEDRTQDATFFSPLTERGLKNSKKLVKLLKKIKINVIFSSPFIRTLQTVRDYSKLSGIKVQTEYGLEEFIIPGPLPKDSFQVTLPEYLAKRYNVDRKYQSIIKPSDLVWDEKISGLNRRLKKVLGYIMRKYANTDANILIVSHQTPLNAIIQIAKTNKNSSIPKKLNLYHPYPKGGLTLIFDNSKWRFLPINWTFNS